MNYSTQLLIGGNEHYKNYWLERDGREQTFCNAVYALTQEKKTKKSNFIEILKTASVGPHLKTHRRDKAKKGKMERGTEHPAIY